MIIATVAHEDENAIFYRIIEKEWFGHCTMHINHALKQVFDIPIILLNKFHAVAVSVYVIYVTVCDAFSPLQSLPLNWTDIIVLLSYFVLRLFDIEVYNGLSKQQAKIQSSFRTGWRLFW